MVTLVSEEQLANAIWSMLATPFGMVTLVSEVPLNAENPMLLTLFGMVTSVSELQTAKALSPMLVTLVVISRS